MPSGSAADKGSYQEKKNWMPEAFCLSTANTNPCDIGTVEVKAGC